MIAETREEQSSNIHAPAMTPVFNDSDAENSNNRK